MSVNARPRSGRSVFVTTDGMNRLLLISPVAGAMALVYVVSHGPPLAGGHGIGTGLAAIYLGVLSIAAPVVVARLILRLGNAGRSIAGGMRTVHDSAPSSLGTRWQLMAIIAGAAISLTGLAISARLAGSVEAGTHPHALALFTGMASTSLLVAGLTPAPGLVGWAVLLGLVDATRVTRELRVQRAARLARVVGVPLLGAGGAAAALLGSPLLGLGGALLGAATWIRTGRAVNKDVRVRQRMAAGHEALVLFVGTHTAGDVAVRVDRRIGRDDTGREYPDVPADLDTVSIVEEGGRVVGAIGPRERAAHRAGVGAPWTMVPIASIVILEPRCPAVELLPELGRHGFALVSGPVDLGYVTPSVLGRVVGVWLREPH